MECSAAGIVRTGCQQRPEQRRPEPLQKLFFSSWASVHELFVGVFW